MTGTVKSSGSLHCCEHFVCVALSSLPIQSWNWLQAAVVNNVYYDFMDATNIQLWNHLHNT